MKKIYYILLAMLAMSFTFTACNDDEPFSTATADDDPRILDPIFTDGVNGKMPVIAEINRDANLIIKLTVTPADYASVSWLIDSYEVQKGLALDINLKAGTYKFKVIVSTEAGKSTYREGTVQVNPLPDDPWVTTVGVERIITQGTNARFYGNNLDKVKSIIIDGKTITDITYVEAEDGDYLEYSVPADLAEGEHRVILVDANSSEYGANTVSVTKDVLITGGTDRIGSNKEWVITGLNLDKIASLTFAGQTFTQFIRQTVTEIAITSPDLQDGEYALSGKTSSGEDVQFYTVNGTVTEQTVIVSSKIVLWEGHHYVSWDLPDGDPNKTFNLIGKDVFASMKAGAILNINYSVAPGDAYHKLETRSGNWEYLPGTTAVEFSEDGVLVLQLTQDVLNMIQAQNGFICVGHGYYVDLVTVQ